jgi:hypothetical protein
VLSGAEFFIQLRNRLRIQAFLSPGQETAVAVSAGGSGDEFGSQAASANIMIRPGKGNRDISGSYAGCAVDAVSSALYISKSIRIARPGQVVHGSVNSKKVL